MVFHSALVPPYVRKTRSLEAVIPWLYLKGISTGEMEDALQVLVGESARGLSASTVSRLKSQMEEGIPGVEGETSGSGSLGLHLGRRDLQQTLKGEQGKLCALVVMGGQ